MFRRRLKNLVSHKFRSIALMLTVVLGVSFVSGTYVLTDTITNVFDDIFDRRVLRSVDVNVRQRRAHSASTPLARRSRTRCCATSRRSTGVDVAEGSIFGVGADIIDADGDRVGNQMAPSFGPTWARERRADTASSSAKAANRPHRTKSRSTLQSFADGGFALGDAVMLVTPIGTETFTLVGVAGFGRAVNIAGATIGDLRTADRAERLAACGEFDSIDVARRVGSHARMCSRTASPRCCPTARGGHRGSAHEPRATSAIADALGFFQTFMLVFAFVALFVGAFIIYNTFGIVILERTEDCSRCCGRSGPAFAVIGVRRGGIGPDRHRRLGHRPRARGCSSPPACRQPARRVRLHVPVRRPGPASAARCGSALVGGTLITAVRVDRRRRSGLRDRTAGRPARRRTCRVESQPEHPSEHRGRRWCSPSASSSCWTA